MHNAGTLKCVILRSSIQFLNNWQYFIYNTTSDIYIRFFWNILQAISWATFWVLHNDFFFFLRDFIFQKTLYEKLQTMKIYYHLMKNWWIIWKCTLNTASFNFTSLIFIFISTMFGLPCSTVCILKDTLQINYFIASTWRNRFSKV